MFDDCRDNRLRKRVLESRSFAWTRILRTWRMLRRNDWVSPTSTPSPPNWIYTSGALACLRKRIASGTDEGNERRAEERLYRNTRRGDSMMFCVPGRRGCQDFLVWYKSVHQPPITSVSTVRNHEWVICQYTPVMGKNADRMHKLLTWALQHNIGTVFVCKFVNVLPFSHLPAGFIARISAEIVHLGKSVHQRASLPHLHDHPSNLGRAVFVQ